MVGPAAFRPVLSGAFWRLCKAEEAVTSWTEVKEGEEGSGSQHSLKGTPQWLKTCTGPLLKAPPLMGAHRWGTRPSHLGRGGPWSRSGSQCCRVGGRCVCPSMSNGICTEGLCSPEGHLGAPPRKLCAHFFMAQGLCCVQKSRHLLRARRKPERKSWRVKKFYNHPDPLTPPTMSCFCRHKSDPRQKVWKSSLSITKWNAAC